MVHSIPARSSIFSATRKPADERLGPERLEMGHLVIDLQGPLVQPDTLQIPADEHQLQRVVRELNGRHHGPLDLGLGPAGGLHRQAQRLVHPIRLDVILRRAALIKAITCS